MDGFLDFTKSATVPEHLGHYVRAVGDFRPLRVGPFLGWRHEGTLVLVGFAADGTGAQEEVDAAVEEALGQAWLKRITVLAPCRPSAAPEDAACAEDAYWSLDVPAPRPSQKLANMLRRAAALTETETGTDWTQEHDALVARCSAEMRERQGDRRLSEAGARLFSRLGDYVGAGGGQVLCHSARRRDDGRLCGLAVSDHASYATSFYLFAFRAPDAPPGTADALLSAVLAESERLGQVRCNLGLGTHSGIRFFKRKWGAALWSPHVECTWERKRSFLRSLFGR